MQNIYIWIIISNSNNSLLSYGLNFEMHRICFPLSFWENNIDPRVMQKLEPIPAAKV